MIDFMAQHIGFVGLFVGLFFGFAAGFLACGLLGMAGDHRETGRNLKPPRVIKR